MSLRFQILLSAALLVCLIVLGDGSADAQQPPGRTWVPVTVVLVDRLPHADAPFVLLRRMDASPHDVIMLRTDAGVSDLSAAVQALLIARRQDGDEAARNATFPGASAAKRIRQRTAPAAVGSAGDG